MSTEGELRALSDAATEGPWVRDGESVEAQRGDGYESVAAFLSTERDAALAVALVNAYRAGALVSADRLAEAERLLASNLRTLIALTASLEAQGGWPGRVSQGGEAIDETRAWLAGGGS